MALPDFSMRQLLEAGVHFGHQTHRWNPKMAPYIYGARNNIHIIDLAQTVPMLHQALQGGQRHRRQGRPRAVRRHQAPGVGRDRRRRQALGAVLRQLALARRHADQLEDDLEVDPAPAQARRDAGRRGARACTKKERLHARRASATSSTRRSAASRTWAALPDLLFVIDTNKEEIAIKEASRLGIPVVAIVDTNCDPDGITFPVPGNDDAGRAITLYCDLIARAAIDGISRAPGRARASTSARPRQPVAEELPRPRRRRLGFEALSGPRGVADDLKKLPGVSPRDREEAQRPRHLPLLADRRPRSGRRRTISAKRSACPAASTAGSRRPRSSTRPSNGGRHRARPTLRAACAAPRSAALALGASNRHASDEERIATMANITAAMVKELRDKTGAGMMDCKAALDRDQRRHRGRGRLAAQEGPVQGRQEGRPRRRRRPDRRRRRRHEGRRGRGQFRDRLRRPQRAVPGAGADDRRRRARRPAPTSTKILARQGRQRSRSTEAIKRAIATIGENMTLRRAAGARGRRRARSASYVHNSVADGLGKIGVLVALESPGQDATSSPRSAARSRCTSPPPIRWRSTAGPRPGRGRAREGDPRRQARHGQARRRHREDRRVAASRLLQGSLPARSALRPRSDEDRRAGAEGGRRQGRRADQGHRLRALRARRRHREGGRRFRRRGRRRPPASG